MPSKTNLICFAIILFLFAGNVYFSDKYLTAQRELNSRKDYLKAVQESRRYSDFNKMFIEKILKAEGAVDVETRLELENAVRNLKDAEVLGEWKKFTESTSEKDAQRAVKDLLGMLAAKSIQ